MVKVKENLAGMVFGRLTVKEQADDYISPSGQRQARWLCECSCKDHNQIVVAQQSLKRGITKSCGCLIKNDSGMARVKEDLTGKKFGKLTVLKQVEDIIDKNGIHKAAWLCECNCEFHNQIIVAGGNLKSGHTQSCGCANPMKLKLLTRIPNKKDLSGDYGIIWSTNTNEEIYFDLEDADRILEHTWTIDSNGYPNTTINGKTVRMHSFLGYYRPDHHNRNKLDNRKENLIKCTQQENAQNCSLGKNNKSGIIGVYWSNQNKKWMAQITINGKTIHISSHNNKDDAIKARLQAEVKYRGDFAPQRHLFEQYKINVDSGDTDD